MQHCTHDPRDPPYLRLVNDEVDRDLKVTHLIPRNKTTLWPPEFSANGGAYVFVPGSGLFYENESCFYYDPKTTYYYGCGEKKYYVYKSVLDPPFLEIDVKESAGVGTVPNAVEPPGKKKKS